MTQKKTQKFKIGESWYIRLPGGSALSKLKIIDRTPKVVELIPPEYGACSSFYAIADLEFVEKLTD
jgi:hypothetical protein